MPCGGANCGRSATPMPSNRKYSSPEPKSPHPTETRFKGCRLAWLWHPLLRSANSGYSRRKRHFQLCKPINEKELFLSATFRPKTTNTPDS
jgi:hypothetical protein